MVSIVEWLSSDWIRGYTQGLSHALRSGWVLVKDSRDNPGKHLRLKWL